MITYIPIPHQQDKAAMFDRLIDLAADIPLSIISNELPLISNLAVIENIMLPSAFHHGKTQAAAEEWVQSELDRFQMGDKLYHRPNQLTQFETFIIKYITAKLFDPVHMILFASFHYLFSGERDAYFHFLSGEPADKFVMIEGTDYKSIIEPKMTVKEIDFQSWVTHVSKG